MAPSSPRARPATTIGDHLPEGYFRELEKTFAAAAGEISEFFLDLAGLKICLRFGAGRETLLARIVPTLAHLETIRPGPPDFTICCWDDHAAAAKLPLPTRWMLNQAAYSCLGILSNQRFRTFHIDWMRIIAAADLQENIAYCCYGDAARLLIYELSGPLRSIFALISNRRGLQLVHASSIGTSRGTLLFAGPPGCGKSTLALLALQDGLSYQSDDICVLTSEPQPRSLSIYNIAKLREDVFPRFPSFQPLLTHFQEENEEKKAFFYVHRHFPAQVLLQAPVRALVLPRYNGNSTGRLERATPVEAVRGVIAWTIKEIPKSDTLAEKILLQALARLPAYRMEIGRDDRHSLDLIRSLLDEPR